MSLNADIDEQAEHLASFDDELATDEDSPTSLWTIVALAILGLLLIWIILGVWRYLQVIGYGGF